MSSAEPSDWDLFERWRGGDGTSGEVLFDRHFQAVSRFFRTKVPDAAEDLIQQTFLAAVEAKDRIRDGATFKSYLFATARNLLFRRLRDGHRDPVDFTSRSIVDLQPGVLTGLGKRRDQRQMIESLQRIPLDLQIIIELYYWEEMAAPEIADVLDIPVGTVRSRVRRAKEKFAAVWAEIEGVPLSTSEANLESWARRVRGAVDADLDQG